MRELLPYPPETILLFMKVKCPICKKKVEWEGNPFRPFCSERCKMIDLGKWVSEEYRIEGRLDDESPQTPIEKENNHA